MTTLERGMEGRVRMPVRTRVHVAPAALCAVLLAAACDDDPVRPIDIDPPVTVLASLQVSASTLGREPDGPYVVEIDGDSVAELAPSGSVLLDGLSPGEVTVSLSGLGHFCAVTSEPAPTVELSRGLTEAVSFALVCDPRLHVTNTAIESITAAGLRVYAFALADDSTRGRFTGDPAIGSVADYIAGSFADAGLSPPPSGEYVRWWGDVEPGCVPTGPNVVGWLPGSDPELRDEYVLFVAHFDHLGEGSEGTDRIYNGANDNASGTAALMSLARAFPLLDPAPRRSTVFLAVSGEEQGLCGSIGYVSNPPFPLESTRSVLNLDMVGKPVTGSIMVYAAGTGEFALLTPDLAAYVDPGLSVSLRGGLVNSDGRVFDTVGIEEVMDFHSGIDPEYHDVGDHADLLDYAFMEDVTRLALFLGVEMATWNDGLP